MTPWDAAGLGLFSILIVAAMVSDLRHLRIPNSLCLALLGVLVATRLGAGQPVVLGWGLVVGVAALAVGIALYAVRVWGGGDAKLLAVVAAWVGTEGVVRLLATTAVAGGLLAAAFMLVRRRRPIEGMPYGVAIGVGALDWALTELLRNF